jgi:hypothetical protein
MHTLPLLNTIEGGCLQFHQTEMEALVIGFVVKDLK